MIPSLRRKERPPKKARIIPQNAASTTCNSSNRCSTRGRLKGKHLSGFDEGRGKDKKGKHTKAPGHVGKTRLEGKDGRPDASTPDETLALAYLPCHGDDPVARQNVRGVLSLGKVVLDDRRRHLEKLYFGKKKRVSDREG